MQGVDAVVHMAALLYINSAKELLLKILAGTKQILMNMKFLITGANGFIGQVLCDELLRQGQSIRAAVRWVRRIR